MRGHVLAAGILCYGFDAVDFMMLALALPLLISEWHLTLAEAGLMGTAGMAGVGLSGVALGWYADRHGRRRALLASVVTFALFTAALAFARSRWDVMLLRLVAGLGLGGVWGSVAALVNESFPRAARARAISWVLSAWPVGVSLAAVVAGIVLPRFGWRGLFLLGALALLPALYVFLFVQESAAWRRERAAAAGGPAARVGEIFSRGFVRNTLLGTTVAAAGLTAYWGINTWLPTYLTRVHGLGTAAMSRYVLVLNAGMFLGYPLLGWLAGRMGKRRALLLSYLAAAVLVPAYATFDDLDLLLWAGPVLALFFSQAGLLGAYFPELYPTRIRALGAGFCFNVGRGIAALAPFVMGQLAASIGLARGIALCGVVYLCAAGALLFLPEEPAYAGDSG
jgi:predicted MFS family arabinose efflux permease